MADMILPREAIDFVRSEEGHLLREDVMAWARLQNEQIWYRESSFGDAAIDIDNLEFHLNKLFIQFGEFRALFDFRVSKAIPKLYGVLRERGFQRKSELHIACNNIGPRFFVEHGHSTIVLARSIGSDFFVNQNVTIGAAVVGGRGGIPTIGNRVTVRTGAVVIGPITIGDDCLITANAVVTEDMPPGCAAYAPRTSFKQRKNVRAGDKIPQ